MLIFSFLSQWENAFRSISDGRPYMEESLQEGESTGRRANSYDFFMVSGLGMPRILISKL